MYQTRPKQSKVAVAPELDKTQDLMLPTADTGPHYLPLPELGQGLTDTPVLILV